MTKHKVLIPLDRFEFSRNILPSVRRCLSPTNHRLVLLGVDEPLKALDVAGTGLYDYYPINHESRVHEYAQDVFEDELLSDASLLQRAGFDTAVAIKRGDPIQEIADYVEMEAVDLVAMATHCRSGLSRLLFGSVATGVLRNVPVPVMLLHAS